MQLDQLLNQRQAASLIGVSERTLECWRCRGGGPPFVKISRRAVRYRRQAEELPILRGATQHSHRSLPSSPSAGDQALRASNSACGFLAATPVIRARYIAV